MFTPNFHLLKIVLLILTIVVLGTYGILKGPETEITFDEALAEPENLSTKEIAFTGKVIEKEDEFLIIRDRGTKVKIKREIDQPEADVGETVSGKGIFNTEGFIEVTAWHHHKFYNLKILTSFIPLAFIIFAFYKNYKFDKGRLIFTER